MKKGAITTIDPGFPVKEWKNIQPATEARISRMPPATSLFQATINITISMKTGILFMRNVSIFLQADALPLKESSENSPINRMESIVSTLGSQ